MKRLAAIVTMAALALGATACSSSSGSGGNGDDLSNADPGSCIVVDMASSPEKITLMTELAKEFNGSDEAKVGERCVFVRPRSKASGAGASLLAAGWPDPDTNGPQPVIWSPAASAWGAVVNQRLIDAGKSPITEPSKPFMLTPLVIAMPKPMAEALGYPNKPLGFSDIIALANNSQGWAAFGHPEWGPFRLGKTNPNFSTSGLNFTIAQYYAATGKTRDLTLEDLARPDVQAFSQAVESSVVHYGDTTLTFLNNMYKADARGTALTYASAVAVEEKSVIDYNTGNPDGILDPGEVPKPPRIPLVSIYPKEGTLFSDSPLFILDAPWVGAEQKQGAALFRDFVTRPENQSKVLEFGFRPGNPSVAIGDPINTANGADPDEPQALLEVPDPKVAIGILDQWDKQRKPARVLLVIDVSGSMGDPATQDGFATKLDLAKQAAIASLGEFKDDDEVGLRVFSTDLDANGATSLDLVPIGPIAQQRAELAQRIDDLVPTNGTPLYDVTADSYAKMLDGFDTSRINAVVLLTDGRNEDDNPDDDTDQRDGLLAELREGSEGQVTRPVRIFPIAYGADADLATLRRVADATTGAAYDSSNPTAINDVFAAVVSNF
ncbi:MAG TPA: extracellular solute-binding protein [Acidimicrobiales bacterium]|nr:extracellular solute-binding protein [Acidimicrobiales bacterium]